MRWLVLLCVAQQTQRSESIVSDKSKDQLAPPEVEPLIRQIRGERVILDSDLARIYGVDTRSLVQAIKRNSDRFPSDFVFRLSANEYDHLRSHFVISKGRGGRRYPPYAFTEHGAIMAANVLNSKQAVQMSVFVVRAFVKLRQTLAGHRELADKLNELEGRVGTHDHAIASIIAAIRNLTEVPKPKSRAIGFRSDRTKSV
jgi:hypothetical protein